MPSLNTIVSLLSIATHSLAGPILNQRSSAVAVDTIRTGSITYYDTGNGGLGSCGTALHNDDHIVALSQSLFDPCMLPKFPRLQCMRMISD